MKKLLLFVLLIVGCEGVLVEYAGPADCTGVAGGRTIVDECGVCGGSDIVADGYCQTDLDVLQNFIDLNESLSGKPVEIGNQEWSGGRLITLMLINSQITTLPENIGNLSRLEQLWLSNNLLINIPESIGDLSSLIWLNLLLNGIASLPISICNLSEDCEINVQLNALCEEYHYDCIDIFSTQLQSHCCEGENSEPNWTQCP